MNVHVLCEWTTSSGLLAVVKRLNWDDNILNEAWFCGYVERPAYLSDANIDSLDVHGGITWRGPCPELETHPMVGFDTCHGFETPEQNSEGFAKSECERLAAQIVARQRTPD